MKISKISNFDDIVGAAIKKSIEFFLGRMIQINFGEEINDPSKYIMDYLEKENIYLRDVAIKKKFLEHLIGKEFSGLISKIELTGNKEKEIEFPEYIGDEEKKFIKEKLKL